VWGGDQGGSQAVTDEVTLDEITKGISEAGGSWPHRRCAGLCHLILHPRGGG